MTAPNILDKYDMRERDERREVFHIRKNDRGK